MAFQFLPLQIIDTGGRLLQKASTNKPQSTGPVRVNGKNLEIYDGVSYVPYRIKGFCYQPTPVGESPDGQWRTNPAVGTPIYQRDFPLISNTNANTIYTFREASAMLLNEADANGIKVIAGFWIDPRVDLSNTIVRNNYIWDFKQYVDTYKGHPALLFWAIGNESYNYTASNGTADIYSLFDEMALEAYNTEGPTYHPVAVIHRAPPNIDGLPPEDEIVDLGAGNPADDTVTPNIDIWGTVAYRKEATPPEPSNYQDLISAVNVKTAKPVWIAQWGHDAYHTTLYLPPAIEGYEDAVEQLNNNIPIAQYFNTPATKVIGATFMEYSDEWSRSPADDYNTQGNFGLPISSILEDGILNLEYLGTYEITNSSVIPNLLTPRPLAAALAAVWLYTPKKLDISIDIHFSANQICFSVIPDNLASPYKAQNLMDDMVAQGIDIVAVQQWNAVSGFNTYTGGPNNFDIDLDRGMFVYAASPGIWSITGWEMSLFNPIPLYQGWNLISIPTTTSVGTDREILEQINTQAGEQPLYTVDVIMWWDGVAWESTDILVPGQSNPLLKGNRGYFIRKLTPGVFQWQRQ